jgi:hypothetical protein
MAQSSAGLWLTSDGPVQSLPPKRYSIPTLSEPLPEDAFFHYLYFSDTNSFIFIAALDVKFAWVSTSTSEAPDAV